MTITLRTSARPDAVNDPGLVAGHDALNSSRRRGPSGYAAVTACLNA